MILSIPICSRCGSLNTTSYGMMGCAVCYSLNPGLEQRLWKTPEVILQSIGDIFRESAQDHCDKWRNDLDYSHGTQR